MISANYTNDDNPTVFVSNSKPLVKVVGYIGLFEKGVKVSFNDEGLENLEIIYNLYDPISNVQYIHLEETEEIIEYLKFNNYETKILSDDSMTICNFCTEDKKCRFKGYNMSLFLQTGDNFYLNEIVYKIQRLDKISFEENSQIYDYIIKENLWLHE